MFPQGPAINQASEKTHKGRKFSKDSVRIFFLLVWSTLLKLLYSKQNSPVTFKTCKQSFLKIASYRSTLYNIMSALHYLIQ